MSSDKSGFVNCAQTAFVERGDSDSALPWTPHPPSPRTSVSPSAQGAAGGDGRCSAVSDADSAQPWEAGHPILVTIPLTLADAESQELRWFVPITELEGSYDLNSGLGDARAPRTPG